MQEEEFGGGGEVHQRTTGGTGGGGRLNMGKEEVDAFLEGTVIWGWEGVDEGDVPGEVVPPERQDSHSDRDSPSSERAELEFDLSPVEVGDSPEGL